MLSFRKDQNLGWIIAAFSAVAVVSFVLAVGAGNTVTRPFFEWLFWHVPFFNIFRDSQKFVALLCLSYAFLGGLGVQAFGELLKQERKKAYRILLTAILTLSLVSPGVYSIAMFGFLGQLGVTDYPKEWYEVNEYLNKDKDDFNVLFLPFHEFMNFDWLPNRDKRLGNPARAFFEKPIIQGDNIEMPGIYTQSQNPISHYVSLVIDKLKDKKITNLGELLAPLNVKYVILVKEVDYEKYNSLYEQDDLKLELRKQGITLFKNAHVTSRVYGVSGVIHIENFDEYLELSLTQDVTEILYSMGPGSDSSSGDAQKIGCGQNNPAKYTISPTMLSYVVFTVPQHVATEYWEYEGQKSLNNLGFMPAFVSQPQGGNIVYTRFYRVYLPGYAISSLTVLVLVWFSMGRRGSGRAKIVTVRYDYPAPRS